MCEHDVSVVIGFRDWGAQRVRRSVMSIIKSLDSLNGEIVISDYGSADPEPARRVAHELGVKYVYTSGDPLWSRSRALNAGFAVSTGALLISTDADMLFSPLAMRRIVETAHEAEHVALFLQCRDLPEQMADSYFEKSPLIDWDELERYGRLRPRWGMGGMMAIPREGFELIRGFDERLHTYGGEDLDFAQRARRAGYKTVWVDDPSVRMYHMWHPPTSRSVEQTEAGREAVKFNRNVVYSDKTFTRNTTNWKFAPPDARPLVSVVFATRDRSQLLAEAITSVLAQTVQDFEVLVIDDGSETDDTRRVLESFRDKRLRYFRQDHAGISAARNLALRVSRGVYTAVMDDDDLMPPHRLEWQLDALTDGYVGSVGSFINFDDETGDVELIVSKNPTLAQAVDAGGAPGHGTWLIRTDVMRAIRYDETVPSGVDNNFFLRLLRSGYKIAHCARPVLLRRQHHLQVTATDASNQTDAAQQSLRFLQFNLTNWHTQKLAEEAKANAYPSIGDRTAFTDRVRAYLPDKLVRRNAEVDLESVPKEVPHFDGRPYIDSLTRDGIVLTAKLHVKDASYRDLALLAKIGTGIDAQLATEEQIGPIETRSWYLVSLDDFLRECPVGETVDVFRISDGHAHEPGIVVYSSESDGETEHLGFAHAGALEGASPAPWIRVGLRAEEYWR